MINWQSADDMKKIEEAQIFIDSMCPGAGFNDVRCNHLFLKLIAVGRANFFPLVTILRDMYDLSLINEYLHSDSNSGYGYYNGREFSDRVEWSRNRCKWPKSWSMCDRIRLMEQDIDLFGCNDYRYYLQITYYL